MFACFSFTQVCLFNKFLFLRLNNYFTKKLVPRMYKNTNKFLNYIAISQLFYQKIQILGQPNKHGVGTLRFGGTVPTQNNLLLKYSKFKMIGIIIYNYIATTFFFLLMFQFLFSDFFGSGSEREGLWVWDLGLRFSGF